MYFFYWGVRIYVYAVMCCPLHSDMDSGGMDMDLDPCVPDLEIFFDTTKYVQIGRLVIAYS